MSGGGPGEERAGPPGEAARGGGGQQRSTQRSPGLPLRGPGLRPAGEADGDVDVVDVVDVGQPRAI